MKRDWARFSFFLLFLWLFPMTSMADLPSPAGINSIRQEGRDVLVVLGDADYDDSHFAGKEDYSLVRVSQDECQWTILFRESPRVSGSGHIFSFFERAGKVSIVVDTFRFIV